MFETIKNWIFCLTLFLKLITDFEHCNKLKYFNLLFFLRYWGKSLLRSPYNSLVWCLEMEETYGWIIWEQLGTSMVFLSKRILMLMVTRPKLRHSKKLLKNVIRCGVCRKPWKCTSLVHIFKIFWRWQDRPVGQLMTKTSRLSTNYLRDEILGIIPLLHQYLLLCSFMFNVKLFSNWNAAWVHQK